MSPMNLFEGKEVLYKPFLGTFSGAVKLEYTGTKKNVKSESEIWENGNKTQTLAVMKTQIADNSNKFDGAFAVSVKQENLGGKNPQYVVTYALSINGGTSSSEIRIDKDLHNTMQGTVQLTKSLDITDMNSAIVWGIQATDQNGLHSFESVDETIKKAKWAMVFRISMED